MRGRGGRERGLAPLRAAGGARAGRGGGLPPALANLRPVEGAQETALLDGVGFVGVTDPFREFVEGDFPYGLEVLDEVETVRRHARELRAAGAELVVVLSHLGLDVYEDRPDQMVGDRRLAEALQGEVDVILGAHSHDLLPEGEWVGTVLVAQAGSFAEHFGRVEVDGGELSASVLPVPDETPPHRRVLAAAEQAERDLDASLDEVIAELDRPLDAQWIAEILRERMGADVGLVNSGQALDRDLPPGPLRRRDLWEACHSTANPGAVELTGARLRQMIERAADPEFQRSTTNALRGKPRGPLHVDGLDGRIEDARTYLVAATDFELERYGGMVDPAWQLRVRYDFPTILCEAIEEHLQSR